MERERVSSRREETYSTSDKVRTSQEATNVETVDVQEIDEILNSIDELLSDNAEEFVNNFKQKNGQ